MKIFIDANIIIDFLANRKPFGSFAYEIMERGEKGELEIYTSATNILNCHYILKKAFPEIELRALLTELSKKIRLISIDENLVLKSLQSTYNDLEDAVQIKAASSIRDMQFIITRDLKDYKHSEIPALSPDEFCQKH